MAVAACAATPADVRRSIDESTAILQHTDAKSLPALLKQRAARIRAVPDAANDLEQPGTWQGELEQIIYDDPASKLHRVVNRLRNEQGSWEVAAGGLLEAACGTRISVEGARIGGLILGQKVESTRAAAPSDCIATGEQRTAVLLVKFPGSSAPTHTAAEIRDYFTSTTSISVDRYWREASYGRAWATVDVFGWFTLDQDYSCERDDLIRTAAIEAADSQVDFRLYKRIFIILPMTPGTCENQQCSGLTAAGFSTKGCVNLKSRDGAFNASVAFVRAEYLRSREEAIQLFIHEGGHSLGLGHSVFRSWDLRESLGPVNDPGSFGLPYSDFSSAMGGGLGHYNAPEKAQLGWLDTATNMQQVETGGTFDLGAFGQSGAGLRAIKVRRSSGTDAWLWIENRQSLGSFESTLDAPLHSGATIHYEDSYTRMAGDAHLIDMTPGSGGYNIDAPLPAGSSWTDRYTGLTMQAAALSGSTMKVTVSYPGACVTLVSPGRQHGAGPESGTIQVIAPAGCTWTARTSDSWITFTTPTSGTGNGSIGYQLAVSTIPRPHTGVVDVGGARYSIERPASVNLPPWKVSVSPGTGSGSEGIFTIEAEDLNGFNDIQSVYLNINSEDTRANSCHFQIMPAVRRLFFTGDDPNGMNLADFGTSAVLSNNQCSIHMADSTLTVSGNRVTAAVRIVFKPAYLGSQRLFALVRDKSLLELEREVGSWKVTPAAGVCSVAAQTGYLVPASGGTIDVPVTVPYGDCAWSAASKSAWLTLTGTGSYTTSAVLRVSVAANSGPGARSGWISAGDQLITIAQPGSADPVRQITSIAKDLSDNFALAVDAQGAVYYGYLSQIQKVGTDGKITVVAGSLIQGFSGDGGPATQALFGRISGLAFDASGNLFVADTDKYRIRKIAPNGIITTVAGNGTPGYSGDNGPGTSAQFTSLGALATDASGNLFIVDEARVRKLTPQGIISTVAGGAEQGFSGDGGPATSARLQWIFGLATDAAGNLYIADAYNRRLRKVTTSGIISTVAGFGPDGDSGDDGPALNSTNKGIYGVTVDPTGKIYVADANNQRIRRIMPDGTINTVAGIGVKGYRGDGGPAPFARFHSPRSLASDASGNIYVWDWYGYAVRKLTPGAPPCIVRVDRTSATALATGGSLEIDVDASAPECTWDATSQASWIRLGLTEGGRGNARVPILVTPNADRLPRTGTVVVASTAITITQAGNIDGTVTACRFTLAQPSVVPHAGQELNIEVTASAPACAWTASSNAAWAQVYPLSGTGTARVSFKVYPNFSSVSRTARLTVEDAEVQVIQAGSPVAVDDRFVGHIYFAFMGRYPTAEEVAFQVNDGLRKGLSRADLVLNFLNSNEFNFAGRFIAGLYVGLLNRDPEFGGWLFQRNALVSNIVNQGSLVKNFLESVEWGSKFGNPSDEQFVRQLYRYVMLREASDSEVSWHAANLRSGMKRSDLASGFLNAAEFRDGVGPRLTAFLLHATILGRAPSPEEMTTRSTEIRTGKSVKTIINEILATSEMTDLLK